MKFLQKYQMSKFKRKKTQKKKCRGVFGTSETQTLRVLAWAARKLFWESMQHERVRISRGSGDGSRWHSDTQ